MRELKTICSFSTRRQCSARSHVALYMLKALKSAQSRLPLTSRFIANKFSDTDNMWALTKDFAQWLVRPELLSYHHYYTALMKTENNDKRTSGRCLPHIGHTLGRYDILWPVFVVYIGEREDRFCMVLSCKFH